MLGAVIALLVSSYYMCLRLTGRGGHFPRPLSAAEEKEALALMSGGDARARERLILHNLRLVPHVIKKYYTQASDQEDLISIGTVGLVKAIDSYNAEKTVKLPTYACKCIQNEIFMHFRGLKKRSGELSLSDPIEGDGDGAPLSVMDVLRVSDDTQERLEHNEECARVRALAREALEGRGREVIALRYGLYGGRPLTQREVAGRLNISRSYVSRIEKKALEELGRLMPGNP